MDFIKSQIKKHSSAQPHNLLKTQQWSRSIVPSIFSVAKSVEFGLPGKLTSMAYEPIQSLLAIGTSSGSLHVWGTPGVYLNWKNRPAHGIKHLCFKPGSPLLACIDLKDTLYVYNLELIQDGVPFREASHSIRSVVMSFAVSPAHSHLFLGLKDGSVDCFDLDRGVISPYRIRNLWLEHEELLRRSGVPGAPSRRHIPVCTDLKFHPLDLNLLILAHEGGISLYDLKNQTVLRSYELVIPPGAIGSTRNSTNSLMFEERRPSVTCLAFRPDGEMFVSGHLDGCLAFWSLENGDVPVLVRTIERDDVLKFDWGDQPKPHDRLSSTSNHQHPKTEEPVREPIFRIAWSAFPPSGTSSNNHGGTLLTVLGGLLTSDPVGVHVLHLPAFQTPLPPKDSNSETFRDALRASITPTGHSVYLTSETPEDFLLIPRDNPYFDGTFDPISIIISTGANFHLPPLSTHFSNSSAANDPATVFKAQSLSDRTLRAFSFPPKLNEEVREYTLPGAFDWIGSNTVIASEVFDLTEDAFRKLCGHVHPNDMTLLPLKGGKAIFSPSFLDSPDHDNNNPSSTTTELMEEFNHKFRVMVTIHMDKKIKFWDFSIRLLLPNHNNPRHLRTEFPARLEHLTIDFDAFITQASSRFPHHKLTHPIGVFLSEESLDLVLTFPDSDLIVFSHHRPEVVVASTKVTVGDRDDNDGGDHVTQAYHRRSLKINENVSILPPSEGDPHQASSGAAFSRETKKESENAVKGSPSEEIPIPTTSVTEPEAEAENGASALHTPKPTLQLITTVQTSTLTSEQLPLESPSQAIPSRSPSPVINRSASQAPPPRPPRSVRRVNESSRSPSRPHTPEIPKTPTTATALPAANKAESLSPAVNVVGLDLSEIQEFYRTTNGFRPVMWVPSSLKQGETPEKEESKTGFDTSPVKVGKNNEMIVGLSDMGFLAVARLDHSFVRVYDLRNMKVLFDDCVLVGSPNNDNGGAKGKGKEKEKEKGQPKDRNSGNFKRVRCLRWIVSALYTDALTLPRLLIGYDDGSFDTLKLYLSQSHMIDSWTATALSNDSFFFSSSSNDSIKKLTGDSSPIACFIFDGNGQVHLTNLSTLRDALSDGIRSKQPVTNITIESTDLSSGEQDEESGNHHIGSVLVIVSKVSVVIRIKINGPILIKKEDFLFGDSKIVQARVISFKKSFAVLLIDDKRSCYVLSLPNLDLICKTFLPVLNGLDTLGRLSIDSSADVVEQVDYTTTHLTTLLLGRDSAYIPHITMYDPTIQCPDPPQPKTSGLAASVASNLVSWFHQATATHYQSGTVNSPRVTGPELDLILAGPNRPEKRKSALQPPRIPQSRPAVISAAASASANNEQKRRSASFISNQKNHHIHNTKDQMNKNMNELEERGDKLENLNERFGELSNASHQLIQQAKRISQQQSAKTAFNSVKSFFK